MNAFQDLKMTKPYRKNYNKKNEAVPPEGQLLKKE